MDSLRLPPLNFSSLPPAQQPFQCELPPISLHPPHHHQRPAPQLQRHVPCHRQYSASVQYITHVTNTNFDTVPKTYSHTNRNTSSMHQPLPSLSPLLNETANAVVQTRHSSPIASYRQSTPPATSSPSLSTSSTAPIPTYSSPSPTHSNANTNTTSILTPPSMYATTSKLPPSIPDLLSSNINDQILPKSEQKQQQSQPQIQQISQPQSSHLIDGELPPPHVPIAPVKKAISTPKGIREVYTCPFPSCTRISSEHSNMKAHMRLHTGERPYVCRVASCRKSFRWKSSLTYHERALHSNSRPYQCIPCRKSFVEKRKLRLHHQLCPAVRAAQSNVLQYSTTALKVASGRAAK